MLYRWGQRFDHLAHRMAPDPFVIAVLLTLLTLAMALINSRLSVAEVLDAWSTGTGHSGGFWNLLRFGMQMCLILVTGYALADSPPIKGAIDRLASRAQTPALAIVIVSVGAMLLALFNWGLGLVGGALLARRVGERAEQRRVKIHYPLLCAAGYMGLLIWHGGLSGSAPLTVTQSHDIERILGEGIAHRLAPIGLEHTLVNLPNGLVVLSLVLLVPWLLCRMHPVRSKEIRSYSPTVQDTSKELDDTGALANSAFLSTSVSLLGLSAWFFLVRRQGLAHLDPNAINFGLLFLGIGTHGSLASYARSVGAATRGCSGIILQFPFYAGIAAVLSASGWVQRLGELLADMGPTALPAAAFYSAGLLNLFIPSGGGQWGLQGPVLMEAALQSGVTPGKIVMAVAYGDQWTNMLQPFWALPLLAITGVQAREILGFTTIVLLFSQIPFVIALYLPGW